MKKMVELFKINPKKFVFFKYLTFLKYGSKMQKSLLQ